MCRDMILRGGRPHRSRENTGSTAATALRGFQMWRRPPNCHGYSLDQQRLIRTEAWT